MLGSSINWPAVKGLEGLLTTWDHVRRKLGQIVMVANQPPSTIK